MWVESYRKGWEYVFFHRTPELKNYLWYKFGAELAVLWFSRRQHRAVDFEHKRKVSRVPKSQQKIDLAMPIDLISKNRIFFSRKVPSFG